MENEVEIKGSLKRFKIDGEYYQYDYAGLANKPDLVTREELEAYDVSEQLTGLLPKFESTYAVPHSFSVETDADSATLGFETVSLDGEVTEGEGSVAIPSATQEKAGLLSASDKAKLDTLNGTYYTKEEIDETIGAIESGRRILTGFDFSSDPSVYTGDYIVKGAVNGPYGETDGLLTVMHDTNGSIIQTWTGTGHTGYRVLRPVESSGSSESGSGGSGTSTPVVVESLTINGTSYDLSIEVPDFDERGVKYILQEPIVSKNGTGATVRRLYLHAGGSYTLSGNVSNMQILTALTAAETTAMEEFATAQKALYDATDGAQGMKKGDARKLYIESTLEYKSTKVTLNNFASIYTDELSNAKEIDEMTSLIKHDLAGGKLKIILESGSYNKFKRIQTREPINSSGGTIFTSGDLIIAGLGFLSIESMGGEHAIKAKAELKFFDKPHVYFETFHDAIHGNGGVYIENGYFYVEQCNDVFGTDTASDDQAIGRIRLYAGELDVINCVETILQGDNLIVFDGFKTRYKNVGDGLFKESLPGTYDVMSASKKAGEYTLDAQARTFTYTAWVDGAADLSSTVTDQFLGVVVLPGATFEAIEGGVIGSSGGGDVDISHAIMSPAELFGEGLVRFDGIEVSPVDGVYTLECPAGEDKDNTPGHTVEVSGYIAGSLQLEAFKVEVQLSDAYIESTNAPAIYYTQENKALQVKTAKENALEVALPFGISVIKQTGSVDSALKAPAAISSNSNIRVNGDGILIVESHNELCLSGSTVTLDGDGNKYLYGFNGENNSVLGTELFLGFNGSDADEDPSKNNKGSIYSDGIFATRLTGKGKKGDLYFYHDNFSGIMAVKGYSLVGAVKSNAGTNVHAYLSATAVPEALANIVFLDENLLLSGMPIGEVVEEPIEGPIEPQEPVEPVITYTGEWVFGVSESAFTAYQATMASIISNLKSISVAPKQIYIPKMSKLDASGAITEVITYIDNKGKYMYGTKNGAQLTINLLVGEKVRLYGLIDPENVTNNQLKWTVSDSGNGIITRIKSDDTDYCDVTAVAAGSGDLLIETKALTDEFATLSTVVHFVVTEPVVEPTPEEPVVNEGE